MWHKQEKDLHVMKKIKIFSSFCENEDVRMEDVQEG